MHIFISLERVTAERGDEKIRTSIFSTFGKQNLPKITTQSMAEEVKAWKDSFEVREAYKKLNEGTRLQNETWFS